ncbi:ABC transporter ATP-binding protein [bacterium]|nr:ABC transporter ATP-binding protein [bacterium]
MPSEVILKAKNLHKYFSVGKEMLMVLQGIDLEIEQGSFWAIVGESGVGKSTLLHLLGLLDSPTIGELYLQDNPVSSLSEKQKAALRNKAIGVMFQFHHLLPEFTALENVVIPQLIAGKDFRKARDYGKFLLDEVHLSDRADHFPNQLSGGEQQRVAFARALANDPDLLLADEPTGNLDEQNSRVFQELIRDLQKKFCKTFILATHNLTFAASADRILRLHNGLGAEDTERIKQSYG